MTRLYRQSWAGSFTKTRSHLINQEATDDFRFNPSTGKWPYQEHNEWDIWFGASAFEGNEYLQGITFEAPISDEITVNLTFCHYHPIKV